LIAAHLLLGFFGVGTELLLLSICHHNTGSGWLDQLPETQGMVKELCLASSLMKSGILVGHNKSFLN